MSTTNAEMVRKFGLWLVTFSAGEVVLYVSFYWIRVFLPVLSGQELKLIQEEWLSKATVLAVQCLIGLALMLIGGRGENASKS